MGLAGSHTMEVQKGIIEAIGNTPLLKLWRVSEATVPFVADTVAKVAKRRAMIFSAKT
jgi:hypothetical protein